MYAREDRGGAVHFRLFFVSFPYRGVFIPGYGEYVFQTVLFLLLRLCFARGRSGAALSFKGKPPSESSFLGLWEGGLPLYVGLQAGPELSAHGVIETSACCHAEFVNSFLTDGNVDFLSVAQIGLDGAVVVEPEYFCGFSVYGHRP